LRAAYVDSSCVLAVLFEESGFQGLRSKLESFDDLFSSNLLEAEVRAAVKREDLAARPDEILAWISWVHPDRPLTPEFHEVMKTGYLRGADLWHVASALFLRKTAGALEFLSLDRRQLEISAKLGLRHPS
jgi:predicted nucleic acid-binding protein